MTWDYEQIDRLLAEVAGPLADSDAAEPRVKKRTRIVEAATAVFLEKGYRGATVDEVAERAGVAKGTVYLYFKNKAALLVTAIAVEKRAYLDRVRDVFCEQTPARERLKRWLVAVFVMAHEMPLTSRLMQDPRELLKLQDEMPPALMSQSQALRGEFLGELVAAAAGDHGWNAVELADRVKVVYGLTMFSTLVSDPRVRDGLSLERYATILAELIVGGLARARARRAP